MFFFLGIQWFTVTATLLVGAVMSTVAAAAFLYVGARFAWERAEEPSKTGRYAFVTWWLGVALFVFLWHAVAVYLVLMDVRVLAVFVVLRYLSFFVFTVAVAGLMMYLAYLFSGRSGWVVPVSLFFAAVFVTLLYVVTTSHPVGLEVARWRIDLVYDTPLGGLYYALLALLILPPVVGALFYFSLRFKTQDQYMAFRITLVSWAIVVWGLSSLLARFSEQDWWQVLTRSGIGLVAALMILFAYETPATVRNRLGTQAIKGRVEAFHEEQEARRLMEDGERAKALRQRMQNLI